MFAIIQLAGMCVITYFLILGVVMLFTQCSVKEAQKKIALWWQENASGLPKSNYELSRDFNYSQEVNSLVEDALGETRYHELCKLNRHCLTLDFCDNHDGLPSVQITLNCNDEDERHRLEAMLEEKTAQYLSNYGAPIDLGVLSYWSQNRVLRLPMLVIMYSRNEKEKEMLDAKERYRTRQTTARYRDVHDDTEEVDLF